MNPLIDQIANDMATEIVFDMERFAVTTRENRINYIKAILANFEARCYQARREEGRCLTQTFTDLEASRH